MPSIRLVCWNEELASERARLLKAAGYQVDASPLNPSGLIRNFRERAPDLVVIDLGRLPSHGREVAVALRSSKATRYLPLVLAGGAKEKAALIRRELPDAVFTSWEAIAPALRRALKSPPRNPVRPTPHMERYADSSLAKKLGIGADPVAVLNPPEDFFAFLGNLEASFETAISPRTRLALWFVRSRQELEEAALLIARLPEAGALWILHPKQSAHVKTDFNQADVRAAGLSAGLVDYKVCSVDSTWSGLKFARRRAPASRASSKR